MDSKRNKRERDDPLPSTSEEEEFRRNWSGLPELALHCISRRLPSIPDFLYFSSVCTSWNSSASSTSTDVSTSFPPFLLLPVLPSQPPPPPPPPDHRPNYMRNRVLRAECCVSRSFHPTHLLLQTLTLEIDEEEEEEEEILPKRRTSFRSNIPSEVLTLPCLGYTDGILVFLSAHENLVILADAFTGTLRRVVLPPDSLRHLVLLPGFPPRIPLLTAAGTHLLLASESVVLSYRLQTDTWSQLDHGAFSLAAVKDQVFCIGPDYNSIAVIESTTDAATGTTSVRMRPTGVSLPSLPEFSTLCCLPEFSTHCSSLGRRLVACGSDLLLLRVRLHHVLDDLSHVLDVFRLDSETSTWAEVEGLDGWCLFLDAMGSSATACPDPARWGGKNNCAYITGPGCNSWLVVPLDGDRQFVIDDGDSHRYNICKSDSADQLRMSNPVDKSDLCTREELLMATKRISELYRTNYDAMIHEFRPKLRWPSPVWVYPTRLHGCKENFHISI